jgi:periplasmic protein TonB
MRRVAPAIWLAMLFTLPVLAQGEARRVTKSEALSAVASKVQPDYPPIARQLHVEGVVELEAVVSASGAVAKVNIVSGNPMLTGPTSEALKRWKFRPFLEDGKPIQVVAPVSFTFKM